MKKNILQLLTLAIALTAIILVLTNSKDQKKVAFIDYNKVYNDCQMKKDLEKDLMKVTNLRKGELDSLQMELSFLSEKINSKAANNDDLNRFEDLKNRFLGLQDRYEGENIRLKETYFTQIREHINQKAEEYSISHGFDYLFSANGDGALMYASEEEDVSADFLKFVDQ